MANYQVKQGTVYEDFETLGDWTVQAGSAVADKLIFKTGTQSLKVTSAVGGAGTIHKVVSSDFSALGVLSFDVYIVDVTTISSIIVTVASNTSITISFSFSHGGSGILHNGWNTLMVSKTDWTNNGSDDWANTRVRLKFQVNAVSSTTAVAYFDNCIINRYNRPKLIVTFDDGFSSAYTAGYPYMRSYGLKGSIGVISSAVGTSGYMTKDQINEMYTAGWDAFNHTATHANLALLDASAVALEVKNCADFLLANGWVRNACNSHFAYPLGSYNDTTLSVISGLGLITQRTVLNRQQPVPVDRFDQLNSHSVTSSNTLADMKAWVDLAISSGSTELIVFHRLLTSGLGTNDVLISDFQALIDYIASKRDQVDVMTLAEWYKGLRETRRIA